MPYRSPSCSTRPNPWRSRYQYVKSFDSQDAAFSSASPDLLFVAIIKKPEARIRPGLYHLPPLSQDYPAPNSHS